jgi:hypothetical protein
MPVSDRLAAQSLSLPMGPHLDDHEVGRVIDAVNAFTDRHEAAPAPEVSSRTPASHAR